MSLFGAFLGDPTPFGEDPFFGGNQLMRQMDSMMNAMFRDPFGGMMMPHHQALMPANPQQQALSPFGSFGGFNLMDPFGMPSMGHVFQSMNQPGAQMFSSSSVMTMTTGPDGRPQVYQASTSTRTAPGGVREVHRSVADSRTGVRKMAVGRHLGERGHVMEKEQNSFTGDAEEREEFINLEEEDAARFNDEWRQRNQAAYAASRHHQQQQQLQQRMVQQAPTQPQLAIAAGPSQQGDHHRSRTHPRGVGPERHRRGQRDGGHQRQGKTRHETSM